MGSENLTLIKRGLGSTHWLLVDQTSDKLIFYEQRGRDYKATQISDQVAENLFNRFELSTEHANDIKDRMGW